jgi:CheY-like chemotaxis protein/nitrogen-specific signal transduction histidine kinase
MVGVALDITERKQWAEELRKRAEQLAEAGRRKDEFLATLAHELRNPLAPIRNALAIMRLAGDNGEVLQQCWEMIERQVKQLVRLVDDLLDASRITRGMIELRKERVRLGPVVNMAVETSRPLVEAAGLELTIELPAAGLSLDADPTRLAQVIANLLNNAAKFTERGGHVWLTAQRDGREVVLRVRDTGIGIPAETLPRLFEMFAQVDRSLGRAKGGLGIGLNLVKNLVELHGGRVEARSDGPGQGSEFVVRLPLPADSVNGEAGGTPREEQAAASPPSGLRVLVADDNRDAAESLAALLRLLGHEVRVAFDGIATLETARTYHPQVVLLDIGMPGLDGYQVAQRLRDQPEYRDALLIALTGWGQQDDLRRSQEAGFDHHLVKPVELTALRELLASNLDKETRRQGDRETKDAGR